MGLKILHSADWHMDSPFASFTGAQREFLKEQQMKIPGKIAKICRDQHCDLVLLAGDIFDGVWTKEGLDSVREALESCAVPVFIAPGNHDFVGPGSPWTEAVWPENVHIFKGGLTSAAVPELNCRVYGAGFTSMDCPGLLEGFRAEGEERYCVAVLHGDPTNPNSPCNPVTAAQVRNSGLDYLALGHIHKSGGIQAGSTLCAWPGCPMGRGWDETGEKGVAIVTVEETAKVKGVLLDTPRFYEKTVEIGENPQEDLEKVLPAAPSRDFYRVTLTGAGKPDFDRKAFDYLPNLTFRDQTRPPVDLWEDAGQDSLRGRYFDLLRQAARNGETREAAVLAAKISRRILEGREVKLP